MQIFINCTSTKVQNNSSPLNNHIPRKYEIDSIRRHKLEIDNKKKICAKNPLRNPNYEIEKPKPSIIGACEDINHKKHRSRAELQ